MPELKIKQLTFDGELDNEGEMGVSLVSDLIKDYQYINKADAVRIVKQLTEVFKLNQLEKQ